MSELCIKLVKETAQTPFFDINEAGLYEVLEQISVLSVDFLETSYRTYNNLPKEHPTKYLFDNRVDTEGIKATLTAYDLGVLFSSILIFNQNKEEVPLISSFNLETKNLVDDYLKKSKNKSIRSLTRYDKKNYPMLEEAVSAYIKKCSSDLPHVMLKPDSETRVRRGVHDFLSVITILSVAEHKDQIEALKTSLGRFAIKRFLNF